MTNTNVDKTALKAWLDTFSGNVKTGANKALNTVKPGVSNIANYVAGHPYLSTGLGVTGAMNLGGLFDNDKLGGQAFGMLGGAGLGYGLLPKLLENVSPQAKVLATLGGGALGSLFDKLRQNKEDQYAQMQQGGMY